MTDYTAQGRTVDESHSVLLNGEYVDVRYTTVEELADEWAASEADEESDAEGDEESGTESDEESDSAESDDDDGDEQ